MARGASYPIRPAVAADLEQIQRIEVAAARVFPPGRIPSPELPTSLDELGESLKSELLWVARHTGEVVGFAMALEFEGCIHLEEMDVLPAFGRRGIGASLVAALIERGVKKRVRGVTLTTFQDIPWNAPFYRRLGFRELASEELGERLAGILAEERQLGLSNRVAMCRFIDQS